jgi:hypothetical protein
VKILCIPPLAEELSDHCFSGATAETLQIDPEFELGLIWKGHLEGCSVTSIEKPPRSWLLGRNHVYLVYSVENMIRSRRRIHILAGAGQKRRHQRWNAECIQVLATGRQKKTKLAERVNKELTKLLSEVFEVNERMNRKSKTEGFTSAFRSSFPTL